VRDHWNSNELELIGATDELAVAPARADGSLHSYTTTWVVRVGEDLYVRSYRGPAGSWFQAAQRSGHGRIRAGTRPPVPPATRRVDLERADRSGPSIRSQPAA
jgi:hypothetical protein